MPPKKNTRKKEKSTVGRCIDCAFGYVMSDGVKGNPLVTECAIDKERYPQQWLCTVRRFEPRIGETIIHPMKYLHKR